MDKKQQRAAMQEITDLFGPVISSYSQGDAIADGVLLDVSSWIAQAGIQLPAVMTRTVCIHLLGTETVTEDSTDETQLRMRKMCKAILDAIVLTPNTDRLVLRCIDVNDAPLQLKAVLSQNDEGKPCMVIMLPDES